MTSGCHLCDLAYQEILSSNSLGVLRLHLIDIADSPVLVEKYGETIPVLKHNASGKVLYWPFSSADIRHWMNTKTV